MTDHGERDRIDDLCERALGGEAPVHAGLELLLSVDEPDVAEPLFAAARALRARYFGEAVFLYGFVYFSTFCRNECTFCFYRIGNRESPRYRKTVAEVVAICRGLAEAGVHLLDLTMGEDPALHETGHFEALIELVGRVHEATGLPVMISPGVVPAGAMRDLRAHGADWYACYQETHNRELYQRLRVGQSYAARVAAREAAAEAGMLVEDGLLTGIGDTATDRADSLLEMHAAGTDQVRVMTFVPQRGTPLGDVAPPDRMRELVTIAAMRLLMPDRLIPASLDVDGIAGLELRLNAGANVVTSLVPPTVGLAGVSQSELDIEEGRRTVAEVTPHLAALSLRPAALVEYRDWMSLRLIVRSKRVADR